MRYVASIALSLGVVSANASAAVDEPAGSEARGTVAIRVSVAPRITLPRPDDRGLSVVRTVVADNAVRHHVVYEKAAGEGGEAYRIILIVPD